MSTSSRLALPFIDAAQAQKHVTHNAALVALDALVHLAVKGRNVVAAPSSPVEGDRYLVGAGATGAFAGATNAIAAFDDGGWALLTPRAGWRVFVEAENLLLLFDGTNWIDLGLSLRALQNLSRLGIGAVADAVNPLAAKLNGALLTARANSEGGSGDLRMSLNKSAAANTVSQIYQTDYSGRAETGLAGDDHFRVKVSADGVTWRDAIDIDPATGRVSMALTSGVAGGLATLDATGHVPLAQLPASAGAAGVIRSGARAPAAADGADGDYWDDTLNKRLWGPKTAGAWPATYYQMTTGGGALSFAYATGDQRANISVTASPGIMIGTLANLVNGNLGQSSNYFTGAAASGAWIDFAFAQPTVVNEVSFWQTAGAGYAQGTWQWFGSNDGASFVPLGGTFVLNGAAVVPVVLTSLAANASAFSHYRMIGASGATSSAPWVQQFQFRQGS